MKKIITKERALERLESLCGRSEQCEFEINRKLINWGISLSDRREIIASLIENKYLDNSRYARSFTNDKAKFSSWGPYKIKMELLKRHIESKYIVQALEGINPLIWKEGLLKSAKAKLRNIDLIEEEVLKNKQKILRYLLNRGYSLSSSSKVIEMLMRQKKDNDEEMA